MHKYMTASPLANEVYATGSVIDLKNMCMEAQTAMPVMGRKDDEYNTPVSYTHLTLPTIA